MNEELLRIDCEQAGLGERYQELLALGNSPRLAHMLAFRQSPAEKGTDRAFWEGRLVSEYDSPNGKMTLDMAKKAGVNTHGRIYVSGLARAGLGPRDPEAWVSGTGDIKDAARKRNLTVEGAVNHTAHDVPPEKPVKLARRVVKELVQQRATHDPDFARKPKREQAEIIIDRHGSK